VITRVGAQTSWHESASPFWDSAATGRLPL